MRPANPGAVHGLAPSFDDVGPAVTEACTNVLQHAAAMDGYEVRLQVDGVRCALSVTNTGYGFDADRLTGVPPDATSPRRRGVAIMRTVMDRVDFTSEPGSGTITTSAFAIAAP